MDGTGTVVQTYLWGLDISGSLQGAGGVGGLVGVKPRNAQVHFAAYDGSGNVTGLVDGSTGRLSANYEYGPFGEMLRSNGPMANANPFRFSTKHTDETTGLVYFGYRYYNPETGRWLQRDPIGESGGLNLYAFNGNSPIDFINPLGLAVGDLWDPRTYECLGEGIKKNLKDLRDGIKELATNPQGVVDGLVDAAYNYDQTARNLWNAAKEGAKKYYDDKFGCGDPCDALKAEGAVLSELATSLLAARLAAKAAQLATKADDLSDAARAADKAEDAADAAKAADKAEDGAEAAKKRDKASAAGALAAAKSADNAGDLGKAANKSENAAGAGGNGGKRPAQARPQVVRLRFSAFLRAPWY